MCKSREAKYSFHVYVRTLGDSIRRQKMSVGLPFCELCIGEGKAPIRKKLFDAAAIAKDTIPQIAATPARTV
jgi:hypothetical protein